MAHVPVQVVQLGQHGQRTPSNRKRSTEIIVNVAVIGIITITITTITITITTILLPLLLPPPSPLTFGVSSKGSVPIFGSKGAATSSTEGS